MGVGLFPLSSEEKPVVWWMSGGGGGGLNQTIVSDVSRLHLDFILCNDSLHIPLLLGDVPDGTSACTGTRGRENRHTQDPNIIFITD